jgi:hypothetical protein
MEPDTERAYLDDKLTRRFLAAIVARAVFDYRGTNAARAVQAGAWLDEVAGTPTWRDVLPVRDGGRIAER